MTHTLDSIGFLGSFPWLGKGHARPQSRAGAIRHSLKLQLLKEQELRGLVSFINLTSLALDLVLIVRRSKDDERIVFVLLTESIVREM